MDFYQLFGYLTGLHFIKPGMEPATLLKTAAMVHLLDAVLCGVVAENSGRRKIPWTIGGLVFGMWALAILFLLPAKQRRD